MRITEIHSANCFCHSFIRAKNPLGFSLGYLSCGGVSTGPNASITDKCSTIHPSNGSKRLRQMGEGGPLAGEG